MPKHRRKLRDPELQDEIETRASEEVLGRRDVEATVRPAKWRDDKPADAEIGFNKPPPRPREIQ